MQYGINMHYQLNLWIWENNLVLYINTKKYKYIRTNTKYIVFEYVKTVQWQNFNWLNN